MERINWLWNIILSIFLRCSRKHEFYRFDFTYILANVKFKASISYIYRPADVPIVLYRA